MTVNWKLWGSIGFLLTFPAWMAMAFLVLYYIVGPFLAWWFEWMVWLGSLPFWWAKP